MPLLRQNRTPSAESGIARGAPRKQKKRAGDQPAPKVNLYSKGVLIYTLPDSCYQTVTVPLQLSNKFIIDMLTFRAGLFYQPFSESVPYRSQERTSEIM